MSVKKNILKAFACFYKKRYKYVVLEEQDYYKRFGIEKDGESYKIKDGCESIIRAAYDKSWENRNYEIDKFWTRAAYFWGFIVLIFGGYITVITSDNIKNVTDIHLDLYLLSLGLLFSLAWWLVIKGSKCWQENWENHIDFLENFISGPIYKTVFYRQRRFYSVSKLNEIMAIAVLLVWVALYIQNIYNLYQLGLNNIDWGATITIIVTFLFTIVMSFGYCLGDIYHLKEKGFIDRWE